jgi:hypothetical protein
MWYLVITFARAVVQRGKEYEGPEAEEGGPMTTERDTSCWSAYLSPLRLVLLAVNAVCFGGFLAFLAAGKAGAPSVLVTVGTGLSLFALLTGALVAASRARSTRNAGARKAQPQGQEHDV